MVNVYHGPVPPPPLAQSKAGGCPEIAMAGAAADGPELLLVEDTVIIAIDFKDRLQDAGASAVTIALKLSEAQDALLRCDYDGVVLDVKLGSENSLALADALLVKDIPVVFVTGYDTDFLRPASLRRIPVYEKPVSSRDLTDIVHSFDTASGHPRKVSLPLANLFANLVGTKAQTARCS